MSSRMDIRFDFKTRKAVEKCYLICIYAFQAEGLVTFLIIYEAS